MTDTVVGYSVINSDGGSATGGLGVSKGLTKGVTFTASSALVPDASGNVELLIDVTTVTSRVEALRCLELIKAAIVQDNWPPTGLSS